MIFVECPYCNKDINILFGQEIKNLTTKGISDCECNYCKKIFEIYLGEEKIETRTKRNIRKIY